MTITEEAEILFLHFGMCYTGAADAEEACELDWCSANRPMTKESGACVRLHHA
jgi:hypothetical protein